MRTSWGTPLSCSFRVMTDIRALGRAASRGGTAARSRSRAGQGEERASQRPNRTSCRPSRSDICACAGCSRCLRRPRPTDCAAVRPSRRAGRRAPGHTRCALPASTARTRYSISSPDDHGSVSRDQVARRTHRRSRGRAARRKIVNEIARFQRLSRVRRAPVRSHEGDESPSASTARPVKPSRPAISGEAASNPLEQIGRVCAVVVRERDDVGGDARSSATFRARERPRADRRRWTSNSEWCSSNWSRRPSSFWSTSKSRKRRCVWRSSEANRRFSCSTRSTVATMRSNEGSSTDATAVR